jgi:hypothetical protein
MGYDRLQSVMLAYDRCATAMIQTTLIGGLGLAVFATSTFTPTQQFGYLMISMLGAALIGDLLMLPALLVSPLGKFFSNGAPAQVSDIEGPDFGGLEEQQLPPVLEPVLLAERQPLLPIDEKQHVGTGGSAGISNEATASASEEDNEELLAGPHAALHAKLRSLRRDLPQDPVSS